MPLYETRTSAASTYSIGMDASYNSAGFEDWRREIQQWHTLNSAALTAPDGPLSLVGLALLKPGDNSVGTAPDSDIRLSGFGNTHLAIIRVKRNSIELISPKGGFPPEFAVNGRFPSEQIIRVEGNAPTKFTAGTLTFFVIRRQERYLLRIKDTQSPTRLNFKGSRWYEPDAGYRIEAEWIPSPQPETIHSIIGTSTQTVIHGVARFTLHAETFELKPLTEQDGKILLFVVRDKTSGDTTFANGRFLYTGLPDRGLYGPGKLMMDFNRLENPPCAYTPYATCPLPPESNRMEIPIFAGALRYYP
jgi:uncharacterized protein (DUF1684 family)